MNGVSADPEEGKAPRLRSPEVIIGACVAGVLLLVVLLWLIASTLASRAFERECETVRARGEPVTPREFVSWASPAGGETLPAAELLLAAAELDNAAQGIATNIPRRMFSPSQARALVEANAAVVRRALKALEGDAFGFAAGLSLAPTGLEEVEVFRHQFLHEVVRMLVLKGRVEAEAGRPEACSRSLRAALKLIGVQHESAHLFWHWHPVAANLREACLVMRRLVDVPSAREELLAMRGTIRGYDARKAACRFAVAARVRALNCARGVVDGTYPWGTHFPNPEWARWRIALFRPRYVRDMARLARLMTAEVGAATHEPWVAVAKAEELVPESWGPLSGYFFTGTSHTFASFQAVRDTCSIGLSLELYRSKHGRYPGKLDGLAPEFLKDIPPDPFTGRPFVYKLKDAGKGFVVYSVGPNLTDDGGVDKRSSGKDDIAWEGGPGAKKN